MNLIATPLRISSSSSTFDADFKARLHWSVDTDAAIEQRVIDILADVQTRGNAAVLDYTARFDGLEVAHMGALELTQAELKAAFEVISPAQRAALEAAARRVRTYHEAQKKANGESWSYRDEDGSLLGQKVIFPNGHGRVDIPGADQETMNHSLARLAVLPLDVVVYPGHGITTTIGAERWLQRLLPREERR